MLIGSEICRGGWSRRLGLYYSGHWYFLDCQETRTRQEEECAHRLVVNGMPFYGAGAFVGALDVNDNNGNTIIIMVLHI